MTDLHSLLTRVEAATAPDRQIDCLLDCLRTGREFIEWTADTGIVGYRFKHPTLGWELGCWRVGYTASLDAALALVEEMLPGWDWSVRHSVSADGDVRYANAVVWLPSDPRDDEAPRHWANHDHSPALALLSALLRALIAKQEVEDAEG